MHGRSDDQDHSERSVPRDGTDEDHRSAGQRDSDRRRTRGISLPLRRPGEQTVLRRDARTHRIPGAGAGGQVGRASVRMLVGIPAILAFALALRAAEPSVLSPSLTVDLDGDGTTETARATAARGSVQLEILDDGGRRLAEAKAPAPPGTIVPITLTSAPLGSPGALIVLVAATDTMSCRTVWRYHARTLASLPIRDAAGKDLPACAPPGGWTEDFRAEEGRPSVLVRERVEK